MFKLKNNLLLVSDKDGHFSLRLGMELVWCELCDYKHSGASWWLRLQERIKDDRIDADDEEIQDNKVGVTG